MDPDDAAYRKSVRNMSMVLAAIVLVIFAALFIPPYLFPVRDSFQSSASLGSPQGFTLNLEVNATSVPGSGRVNITAWAANGGGSSLNVSVAASWGVNPDRLWTSVCTPGFPLGVGVMEGHYDDSNYTLGQLLVPAFSPVLCPARAPPGYFDFFPHSSRALVDIGGAPSFWTMEGNLTFSGSSSTDLPGAGPGRLPPGVYTAVAADEWGDVLTTNFRVGP
jgi:hypothetical protein